MVFDGVLLTLGLGFVAACLWWVFFPSIDQVRLHILVTGLSKGNITPFVSQFPPYQDKTVGGAAHLAGLLQKLRQSFQNEPSLTVALGGDIFGSPEAYFSKGQAVISAMNTYGLSAMLVGNIEFTFGLEILKGLTQDARFPFLSSNILEIGTETPPPYLLPEKLESLNGLITVGILGITPPGTPEITAKSNVSGLRFVVPGPELAAKIEKLRQKGAHTVILLSQYNSNSLSPEEWNAIRQAKPDVFLMIDYEAEAPAVTIRDGIVVKTLSGYNQGKEIEVIDLTVSLSQRKILDARARRVPILTQQIAPLPSTDQIVTAQLQHLEKARNEKLTEFSESYERQYDRECPIGNLVCDAMRDWFKADLALQNSGGIQANIKKGVFTSGDLYNILPFDNQTIAMDVNGALLREMLTQAASLKRGTLQISGGSYTFSNRSVDDFELKDVTVQGAPLVPQKVYRIVTNSFLSEGGDEYRAFKMGKNLQTGPVQREILRDFIVKNLASAPVTLTTNGRIQRDQ
jgi:2',3'-cyclic-nucleotide 2'-phosphodiesterase (5'-nucleotidase family)